MSKIKKFNRQTCELVGNAVEKAIKNVEKEFGIKISRGGGSFSGTNFTFKLKAATVGEDGEALTREVEAFKIYASQYGLQPEQLYATFNSGREEYKITGISTRSYKNPILCERVSDGSGFKFPAETVKALLESQG